jgi:hypothetical protein
MIHLMKKAGAVRALALLPFLALAGACAMTPDREAACLKPSVADVEVTAAELTTILQAEMQPLLDRLADPDKDRDRRLTQLALSAGGQYGAFGAGFLSAWSHSPSPQPEFDIVTGVSTGAMMATHAFLGEYDQLKSMYEDLTDQKVFRKRPLLSLLWSKSVLDTKPLRAYLEEKVDAPLLDRVADEADKGRRLYVLAVNLTTGRPQRLPLWKVAQDRENACRKQIYIDYIMASAAIPIGFNPVFLPGSETNEVEEGLYVDGGVRLHLFFLERIEAIVKAVQEQDLAISNDLYIIANNDFYLPAERTPENLIEIGGRSFGVITDQLARDSLYQLMTEASLKGWTPRFVAARDANQGHRCAPLKTSAAFDTFCPGVLKCLSQYGEELAKSAQSPWRMKASDIAGFDKNRATAATCDNYPAPTP